MSDINTQENSELDPLGLNLDLNEVDTSMPVLVEGVYVLKVKSVEVVENRNKTGNNLLVIFETCTPTTSVKGQAKGTENDIKEGFQLRQYMPLQANPDKPEARDFRENLATLQDAVTGSTKGNRGPFTPGSYVGLPVAARIKNNEDPDYGLQNNISRLTPVPQ